MQEEKLEKFSKGMQKHYKRQALYEGLLALLPAVALSFTFLAYKSQSTEQFSAEQLSFISIIIPILLGLYLVFLLYVANDIRKKVSMK